MRWLAGAVVVSLVICSSALAYDRQPITLTGLRPDGFGQSTTVAQVKLRGRFPGIETVICTGIVMPGDSVSSWVQGHTRYWDKLACGGYTYTTGKTTFALIFDATGRGATAWTIYRLRNVSVSALEAR
jgi:hypothetical protein